MYSMFHFQGEDFVDVVITRIEDRPSTVEIVSGPGDAYPAKIETFVYRTLS